VPGGTPDAQRALVVAAAQAGGTIGTIVFSRRGIAEFRSIDEPVETVDSNKGHSAYRAAAWLIPAGEVYNVTGLAEIQF